MKQFITFLALVICSTFYAQTEEEMKAWTTYMTPSEMHEKIANDNGIWDTHNTMWMSPEAPPIITKGTAENTMILGGRYQQSKFLGDFNGMPFEGLSTMAYDNASKEFTSTWIDNFGTGMMVMKGKYDEQANAIHLKGEMIEPMTGKSVMVREVFSYVNNDKQILEMFMTKDGKEFKTMELVFTRQ